MGNCIVSRQVGNIKILDFGINIRTGDLRMIVNNDDRTTVWNETQGYNTVYNSYLTVTLDSISIRQPGYYIIVKASHSTGGSYTIENRTYLTSKTVSGTYGYTTIVLHTI